MQMRDLISPSLRRPLAVSAAAALLLALVHLSLLAQQPISSPTSLPGPADSGEPTSSLAEEARALLPLIPPKMPMYPGTIGPVPGEPLPDPDEFKELYGYLGPYYNTVNLNDQVTVLDQSLYRWPISTWKISGMLRNQTRSPVQISGVTARLLGSRGELLATATATVPVDFLRPGEPGPFVIEAPLSGANVQTIDWRVEYVPTSAPERMFELSVYSEQVSAEYGYYLFGRIRNADTATSSARVVAAWLDHEGKGRVLYVDSPKIALDSTRAEFRDMVTLGAGHFENFIYRNKDPELVPLLGNAKLVLWGISK